ncbi:MAG: class B sortase [Peptococcaceae bacterium]|jgi:sortase B|nr:class B sortase [Peptococcaceae bacterium]
MRKYGYWLATGLLLVAFVVSGGLLVRYFLDGRQAMSSAAEARILAERVIGQSAGEPEREMSYSELFRELRELNPETVAWLVIPDSEVRYPVVRAADNEHYLKIGFDGKRNSHGAIFMDYRNQRPFEDFNTVVYGHNMRDKTMFGSLADIGPELARTGGQVLTVSESGALTWQVFSARIVNAETELDMYGLVYAPASLRRLNALIPQGRQGIGASDRILTLSTCASGGRKDYRYILQARLISSVPAAGEAPGGGAAAGEAADGGATAAAAGEAAGAAVVAGAAGIASGEAAAGEAPGGGAAPVDA